MPERSVLVTGAAGAIGGATVRLFLQRGCAVVGLDRETTRSLGADHRHAVADLADEAATAAVVAEALASMPPVSHVVGVAGGALPDEPRTQHDVEAVDAALFRASVDANLATQFVCLRVAVRHLRELSDEDRSVTMTSSFNALSARGMPGYSAAKAGIVGLMYGTTRPLGRLGIRINVVAPGTVRTPRTERLWAGKPDHFERLTAGTALGRLAIPDDVAAAYVALALDLRHVTGHVLVVDGGQTAIHG